MQHDKPKTPHLSLCARLTQYWACLVAVILIGLAFVHASELIWTSDDAFASFRYARNWARGLGLVFNPNERVEGITNPLWTLLLGVLYRAGFDIESAATWLGIVAYLSSIGLLLWVDRTDRRASDGDSDLLPVAALVAVADVDWATFASGGLETSLFTFCLLGACVASVHGTNPRVSGALSGFSCACASMVRPDGLLVMPALMLGLVRRERRSGLLPFALASLPLLGAFHGIRRLYYGDWLPNTYYAKSAFSSWWQQGAIYLGYFAERHWALLGVLSLSVAFAVANRLGMFTSGDAPAYQDTPHERTLWHRLLTSSAVAGIYGLGVVRVGGDFMYARLLVPTIPLLAIATATALRLALRRQAVLRSVLGVGMAGLLLLTPCPVDTSLVAHHGIVDERAYYQGGFVQAAEAEAAKLRDCLGEYPARVAIYGGELRLAYRADFPYAVESHAGLTDRFVAHQPLTSRQRIGHEKSAPAAYLVTTRRMHFAVSPIYAALSDPTGYIHNIHADLCGVDVRLLHWDPSFVDYVRRRGAKVTDYPAWLDRLIMQIPHMPDETVRRHWEMAQHFYFQFNEDERRAQAFSARLHHNPR
ncbi:MAG TPA: hypothetical protein VIV60_31160 [Polyangiaceae bacterium]